MYGRTILPGTVFVVAIYSPKNGRVREETEEEKRRRRRRRFTYVYSLRVK